MIKKTDHNELIPADKAKACESWQMPDLANENRSEGPAIQHGRNEDMDNVRVMPLTASKIEAMHQQARQEGFDQGKREGYQAGLEQGKAELEATKAQLNRLIAQLVHPLAEQDKELEQSLVQLAMVMAKSVVKTAFEMDVDYLLGVARQAIALLPEGSSHIRVLMHPRDAELVKEHVKEQNVDWLVIDADIDSGGCIVKTEHSYIDFTLDKQCQAIVDDLVANLKLAGGPDLPGTDNLDGSDGRA